MCPGFGPDRTRGITLTELIVAFTLLLILFGLVFSFLVPSLKAQARGSARAEMQQEAVVVLNRLEQELQAGAAPGVSLLVTPGGGTVRFSIHPLEGLSSEGVQQWAPQILFYSWDRQEETLIRSVWSSPLPSGRELLTQQPVRLSVEDFDAIAAAPDNGSRRTVARDLSLLRLEHPGATPPPIVSPLVESLAQPLTVTVRLEREVPGRTDPEQVVLTRTIGLRNGL